VHRQVTAVPSEPALGVSGPPCMGCMPLARHAARLFSFFFNRLWNGYSLLLLVILVSVHTSLPKIERITPFISSVFPKNIYIKTSILMFGQRILQSSKPQFFLFVAK
jgi:hypothetical protein